MSNTPLSHTHHVIPTRVYFQTLIALIVLMVITVAVAGVQLSDIGPFSGTVLNQVVALVIAGIKATLVISIFMGVKYSTNLTKLWALAGFIWLPLMLIMFADYLVRQNEVVQPWDGKHESALPRTFQPGGQSFPPAGDNAVNMHIRQ